MAGRHLLPIRIYYEDTDFSGRTYHGAYVRFLERGRTELLRAIAVSQRDLHRDMDGLAFVVRKMSLDFRRAAQMDDVLVVATEPKELRGASMVLTQEIRRGEEVLVTAEVLVAAVRNGRAVPIPAELRHDLGSRSAIPIEPAPVSSRDKPLSAPERMRIGYARTSTAEQEAAFGAQQRDLRAAGCTNIVAEQVSSVAERPKLQAVLGSLKKGDVLVVTKLDRLARSIRDLLEIADAIRERGAQLRVLNPGIDTTTPTGKLLLSVLGSIADFEREIMLERQREGIEAAKAEGKYRGRKASVDSAGVEAFVEARQAKGDAKLVAVQKAAGKFGLSTRQVYRHLGRGE